MLIGRRDELHEIDELLTGARRGESGTLVLRGEAGIGKTTLLDYAAAAARDMQVLRTRGIESESELAFSGLLEALRPLLDDLRRLPQRQAAAVRGALALDVEGDDPFAVFAGALGLLSLAAERSPVLLLVDDAHWLDRSSAEALAFACRRLGDEGIAALWATRSSEPAAVSFDGLPEVAVDGLSTEDGVALVAAVDPGVTPDTARALVQLTGGNPLALVELPRALTAAQREGREAIEQPLPTSPALLAAFGRRLGGLPPETRRLLVIAAASDSADLVTILRAAESEGISVEHLEEAERAGLVTLVNDRLEFRHPLLRAAIYRRVDDVERRAAHHALAESLTDGSAIDRRAWHRALAAAAPDEGLAAELEGVAARAEGRSWQAAARAYEHAARLTPERAPKGRRLLAAARAWSAAGGNDTARPLLEEAATLVDAPPVLAEVEHVLGRIEFGEGRTGAALELLERATERVADGHAALEAQILADTVDPLLVAGRFEHAEMAARRAWELSRSAGGATEIWAALRYGDVLASRGEIAPATDLWLHAASGSGHGDPLTRCAVGEALFSAGEDERASIVLVATVDEARRLGSPGTLPYALQSLSLVETRRGRLAAATEAADEAAQLAAALGQRRELLMAVRALGWVSALLGRERECRRHLEEADAAAAALGREPGPDATEGTLALSLGRSDEAARLLLAVADDARTPLAVDAIFPRSFVPILVEACVRADRSAEAETALQTFETVAERSGRPAARALALRCRAAVAAAEDVFEAALAEHELWGNPFERARTELLYGELLRRRKRRADARIRLRSALTVFDDLGADGWAEQAGAELKATGERARRRNPSTIDDLTPQETTVARLVATGLTNREVASRLFLSPKTIETHLAHVFRKTGVRTRAELAHRFRDSPDSIAAPGS